MRIAELKPVHDVLARVTGAAGVAGWYFSAADDAEAISNLKLEMSPVRSLVAFIGPEGGWTDRELSQFAAANLTAVRLTDTVLRVETAAVAAAAVIGSVVARAAASAARRNA